MGDIVTIAKEHYVEMAPLPFPLLGHWAAKRFEFSNVIKGLFTRIHTSTAVDECIKYAQNCNNTTYDHRLNFNPDIISGKRAILVKNFPELTLTQFPESALSFFSEQYEGVLCSNILFYHLQAYASCIHRLNPNPRGIVEFGCGYGALARLFYLGGHTPYYLIDFPESLFFAEVFLRANFPDAHFSYAPDLGGDFNFIPLAYTNLIRDLPIDIGISQASFQEMTLEATNYYYNLINQSQISSFYSLNYATAQEYTWLDTTFLGLGPNWETVWKELRPPDNHGGYKLQLVGDGVKEMILDKARLHYQQRKGALVPLSDHWRGRQEEMRRMIDTFKSPLDAIHYAQATDSGFDHRQKFDIGLVGKKLADITARFPGFTLDIGESLLSHPDSLGSMNGKQVSNIFFWHLNAYLACTTFIPWPQSVLEIGGGYGGLARLFALNGIDYTIADMPESLFFSEVYLKANGINNVKQLTADAEIGEYDLAISQGTFQEMPQDWVNSLAEKLKGRVKYVYSLNYLRGGPFGTGAVFPKAGWKIIREEINPAVITGDIVGMWMEGIYAQ